MADDPTPTTLRRQLGARLRQLRQDRGRTAQQVHEALGFSISKISRMESGARAVNEQDLAALLEHYQVDERLALELADTARSARRRRNPLIGVTTTEGHFRRFVQSGFVELERDAEYIREFNSGVVPGLLQTEDYMRAMMVAAAPADKELLERAIPHRLARQRRLDQSGQYAAILDEAALLRQIGSRHVMANQMDLLLKRCADGAVDLRIIPLAAGYHPGLNSSFSMLTVSAEGGQELAFVEGIVGFQEFDGDEVTRFAKVWEQLLTIAATLRDTRRAIVTHRDRYRSH